jgi:hypothetical protein
MAVYVDDCRNQLGRMIMSRMIADAPSELYKMAGWVGADFRYLQDSGTDHEHFDICQSKRTLAIKLGAIPITRRETRPAAGTAQEGPDRSRASSQPRT